MPYIRQAQRQAIAAGHFPETAGELNFIFSALIKDYMREENYQRYNDCIGALEACKMELYARKVRPYEDKKIQEHGDVY